MSRCRKLYTAFFCVAAAALPSLSYSEDAKTQTLVKSQDASMSPADHAAVQTLLRIPNAKIADHPSLKDAVTRYLQHIGSQDPETYVKVAKRLGAETAPQTLVAIMTRPEGGQASVDAASMLYKSGNADLIAKQIDSATPETLPSLIATIGHTGDERAAKIILSMMMDEDRAKPIRSASATAMAKHWSGKNTLLQMARENKIPDDVKFEVSNELLGSWDKETAKAARQIPSLKNTSKADGKPFPTVRELSRKSGDPESGKLVFKNQGTCAKCHKVSGEGLEIGPDLTEIGSKLSKEDMYVSILNPSAGISHNYETYACLTADGQVITGLLVNQNEKEVTIKTADNVSKTIADEDIESLQKQEVSLMPSGLEQNLTVQQLVDLVDYLTLLKKPEEARFNAVTAGSGPVSREADAAIAGFDIANDLKVQLISSEPTMLNPSSIDVDHLGRVWVCEVVNYRHFRNPNNKPREEGDRILVLEDTDHDGSMDKKTVFYQGTDIDSPHGICCLGDRVIVSAGENVMVFRDTDGDLKSDMKEILFTGISGVQHDHGIHAFMPGPDGKLYFNFGNEGKQLRTPDGKPIIDLAGNEINDSRNPYQQGMVFRCDLDGSNVETLGWNFRNNWEVAVDSFGALWQSDNDDDGNRGTRINYVMEYGNYGYRNEKTGDYWRSDRIGQEEEIGQRHWHLNDPGVIPNLLQTGAGSPTGITVYEGFLLPKRFRGQMIHTDPGPNVVRAYPVKIDGAGYSAKIENMIKGVRDQWFRPVDVCTAPDGSVIVADWYDPGVGGHRMGDVERGRLFRITVEGREKYQFRKPKFDSIENAIQSLRSPSNSTRFLAGQALKKFWKSDTPNVADYMDAEKFPNPRMRARLMWLLSKIDGVSEQAISQQAISQGLQDKGLNVRLASIRAARQSKAVKVIDIAEQLANDPSPQVRREIAIAIRGDDSDRATKVWTALATQHQGTDRWYLEALGLSADGNWDARLASFMSAVGDDWSKQRYRDIVWRSRASSTPSYLTQLILKAESPSEQERYFRALDLIDEQPRQKALASILQGI